jgi:hypothetical protein
VAMLLIVATGIALFGIINTHHRHDTHNRFSHWQHFYVVIISRTVLKLSKIDMRFSDYFTFILTLFGGEGSGDRVGRWKDRKW